MPFLGESQGTLSNLWGNPGEISDFPTDPQKFSGRAASRPQVSSLLDSGSSSQQELPDFSVTARAGLRGSGSTALGMQVDAGGASLTWGCAGSRDTGWGQWGGDSRDRQLTPHSPFSSNLSLNVLKITMGKHI